MNYVYKQKISCFHLIKKIIISIVLLLILFELYSCSLNKVSSELAIKVTKVGTVKPSSTFVFIYPDTSKLSLSYKAILGKISKQLTNLGFREVRNIKEADYAFSIILDNTLYNNKPGIESYNYNDTTLNFYNFLKLGDIREVLKKHDTFILEAYLINKHGNFTKVMEAYTFKTGKNSIISEKDDKGYIGFVICSIDALFYEKSVFNNPDYQEYYYKCY